MQCPLLSPRIGPRGSLYMGLRRYCIYPKHELPPYSFPPALRRVVPNPSKNNMFLKLGHIFKWCLLVEVYGVAQGPLGPRCRLQTSNIRTVFLRIPLQSLDETELIITILFASLSVNLVTDSDRNDRNAGCIRTVIFFSWPLVPANDFLPE